MSNQDGAVLGRTDAFGDCCPGPGIDVAAEVPTVLTAGAVQATDVVITTGRGDTCPVFPGKRYLDREFPDPAGQGVEAVRPIRDQIEKRVRGLADEIAPASRA